MLLLTCAVISVSRIPSCVITPLNLIVETTGHPGEEPLPFRGAYIAHAVDLSEPSTSTIIGERQ